MHGDVIPDEKIAFSVPVLDITKKPCFDLRGILPFHDFPEGPDWWNLNDYKAVFGQLAKMKMNFFGLHNYPERSDFNGEGNKAEPLIWIGREEDIHDDGRVKAAYPALHFHTGDSTWGYGPVPTSSFCCGGAQLFEDDNFGADYMKNISPWPHSEVENTELFNRTGDFFSEAFHFAQSVGVKICVGTETPVIIPRQMKKRYGMKQETDQDTKAIYKGIFSRITKSYPIDYYWLWTSEAWTWSEIPNEVIEKTGKDILLAYEALEETGKPFTLATCGWVLGPPGFPSQFDNSLPADMPFSCINRGVGYTPVEKEFKNITQRPKWSIPWMEDDPALLSAQLWVGRLRKDALDSYKYGCNGLFGIHWRTRELGPNVSALADAAWTVDQWNTDIPDTARDMPSGDFYLDWTRSEFGLDSRELADIFISLDSKGKESEVNVYDRDAPLVASIWDKGPGAIMTWKSYEEISEHLNRYTFLEKMEDFRPKITGTGNLERFDYWLNCFRFNKATLETALTLKQLDRAVEKIKAYQDRAKQKEMALIEVLPLRKAMTEKWETMTRILLAKITTNGELGSLANLEMHNKQTLNLLNRHDVFLRELEIDLSSFGSPTFKFQGETRIIATTNQSILENGKDFYMRIRVLSESSDLSGKLKWRSLGKGQYKELPLNRMARNVFEVNIPGSDISEDFEYFIEVDDSRKTIVYPVTSGNINQTVVLINHSQN
jgi:hypothetical protein